MNRGRKVADGTLGELRRLAGLPVRIRVEVASEVRAVAGDARAPWQAWSRIGERRFEIRCAEHEKVGVLRSLGTLPGTIVDVDVLQPSLDDIYARFLREEEGGETPG
jgi:Cu-processing system ATP-binding protein